MIYPGTLKKGDTIAIISPSSPVKEEFIDGAAEFFRNRGYNCRVMPAAKGPASGSYAAPLSSRLADFFGAWTDPEVRAILCSRGGYGAVHMLDKIHSQTLTSNPKWLIGFSDVSALHALLFSNGIASLHSPMAKHLTQRPADDECTRALMNILEKGLPLEVKGPANPLNRFGTASGILAGGNLAVLNSLTATGYDLLHGKGTSEPVILFLEDVSEAIYAVERMLYHLYLSGGFNRIAGLIVGKFTDYRPDRNYETMEDMISNFLQQNNIGLPVAFDFPVGHVDCNYPLVEGSRATLRVAADGSSLLME